ncbi:Glucoamylase, intracellular sporulation-specific, partial [Coemansia aciculifera]
MVATVLAILRRFEHMYDINRVAMTRINGINVPIGIAAGRYLEDVYNGVGTSHGNPWSLVTSALAEYHYRLALDYANAGYFVVGPELLALLEWTAPYVEQRIDFVERQFIEASRREFRGLLSYLLAAGDLYMARVARHTANDHTMNEQWNSQTGFGRGAVHLTWSYAAHTAAARARSQL